MLSDYLFLKKQLEVLQSLDELKHRTAKGTFLISSFAMNNLGGVEEDDSVYFIEILQSQGIIEIINRNESSKFGSIGFELKIDENKLNILIEETKNKVTGKLSIRYDNQSNTLSVDTTKIIFSYHTVFSSQADLCRILLKNKTSANKKWSNGEILEAWGLDDIDDLKDKKCLRKVYDSARRANDKIADETDSRIKDFFLLSMKDVCINPRYRDSITFK